MRKPIVWIVKEQLARNESGSSPMDYSPAMEFGDIEFITMHDVPLYGKGAVMDQWLSDASNFAIKYNPMTDFIVPTGQPMAIFLMGVVLGQHCKPPRFLVWRREENRYRVVNIPAPMAVA
jgi:hypothetical protein